jgi:hypothetical protein
MDDAARPYLARVKVHNPEVPSAFVDIGAIDARVHPEIPFKVMERFVIQ